MEFRTLKQLEDTLVKQTPRITSRENQSQYSTVEHSSVKKVVMQVKQHGLHQVRCKSNYTQRRTTRLPKNSEEHRSATPSVPVARPNHATQFLSSVIPGRPRESVFSPVQSQRRSKISVAQKWATKSSMRPSSPEVEAQVENKRLLEELRLGI